MSKPTRSPRDPLQRLLRGARRPPKTPKRQAEAKPPAPPHRLAIHALELVKIGMLHLKWMRERMKVQAG
jgi:hypothetical protein